MQEITLREFLRNYKNYLPIPKEGVKINYRAGSDFYLYPQKQTEADKLRVIARFLAQELRESQQWETVEPLAQSPAQSFGPEANGQVPQQLAPRLVCEAKELLPWESVCQNTAEEYLVANTKDGMPMGPSDWKTVNLCPIHKKVVEGMGGFEVESP